MDMTQVNNLQWGVNQRQQQQQQQNIQFRQESQVRQVNHILPATITQVLQPHHPASEHILPSQSIA